MKLSEAGAERIANYEGFRADAYWDINHWSIGYGTASHEGEGPISRAEGVRRLRHQADTIYGKAVNALRVRLNQNQFDALTSLAYNVGPGVMEGPVGDAVRGKRWEEAADAFLRYDTAGGQVLAGLTRRRNEERTLFLKKPPITYSDRERHLLKVLRDKTASKTRRDRAAGSLRRQARQIQVAARRESDGWQKHDRARRYQGIRRSIRRFVAGP